MATSFQTLTTGQHRSASVSQIEADLAEMWRSAIPTSPKHSAPARACALTLLIYVESETEGLGLGPLIREVTLQNPCRVIVMVGERSSPDPSLTAWVSAHCHFSPEAGRPLCSEEIYVVARGRELAHLPHVVVPLLVPGLPVYFWWRRGRFNPPAHFEELLEVSDRVIVNSWQFSDPSGLRDLALTVRKFAARPAFTDLNWLSLTPWRQLMAQSFDSSQRRQCVMNIAEVKITYGRTGESSVSPQCQALLLAGWLASRLGWSPAGEESVTEERRRFRFQVGASSRAADSRGVVIELALGSEQGQAGINSVIMKTLDPTPGSYSLFCNPDDKSIVTQSELAGCPALERAVFFDSPREVDLLNEDLKFASRDRIYEQALGAVSEMLG